jgi:hypothetical protein
MLIAREHLRASFPLNVKQVLRIEIKLLRFALFAHAALLMKRVHKYRTRILLR